VIRTFRHAGLEKFFKTGSKAGIQPAHATKLYLQLAALDVAKRPGDLAVPAWRLHQLKGNLAGHWSIKVDGNWRMTFCFEGEDAILVNYQDYHGA
jgi:proteic killer suppression protein